VTEWISERDAVRVLEQKQVATGLVSPTARIADAIQTYAFETFVLMHHRISLYFNGQWVDTCFPKVSKEESNY